MRLSTLRQCPPYLSATLAAVLLVVLWIVPEPSVPTGISYESWLEMRIRRAVLVSPLLSLVPVLSVYAVLDSEKPIASRVIGLIVLLLFACCPTTHRVLALIVESLRILS